MKSRTSTCLLNWAMTLILAAALRANAEDKPSVNPTGAWKLTISSTNTQSRASENTLKLKMTGGVLTGTLTRISTVNGAAMTWEIKEAKLQGNDISFTVMNGEVASSYKGTISGDTINGTLKVESPGKKSTRDWEAKRLHE